MVRWSSAVVALVAVSLVTAGCSTADETPPPVVAPSSVTNPSASPQALPPTMVSPDELNGKNVAVVIGTALSVTVPDGTEDQWRGTTDDPTIAEFSAGGSDEGATFRPGFIARKLGTTKATLTGPDGTKSAFTISVVAP